MARGRSTEGRAERRRARRGEGGGSGAAGPEDRGGGLGEWIRALVWAVVLFLVIRTFILQTFVITSGSMENSLLVGDFLVVNRAAIGTRIPFTDLRVPGYSEPRLQDILVFDPPHEEDLKLVKRLVGMPGDTLEMREGVLFRNGARMEEPYVKDVGAPDGYEPRMEWQRDYLLPGVAPREYRPTRDDWGPIVIPEDHFFMLGDNRDESQDSRYWGLLERWRLEGRVSFIYYSYDRESYRPFAFIRDVRPGRIFSTVD